MVKINNLKKHRITEHPHKKNKPPKAIKAAQIEMGDNPLTATQPLLLPGLAAEKACGCLHCFAQPKQPQCATELLPTDLTHAGLNQSKFHYKFSGKWETPRIWGQLTQMQSKQCGCLHKQHTQLIHPGVLSSLELPTSTSDAYSEGKETEPVDSWSYIYAHNYWHALFI